MAADAKARADPLPRPPRGGSPATTRGEQRGGPVRRSGALLLVGRDAPRDRVAARGAVGACVGAAGLGEDRRDRRTAGAAARAGARRGADRLDRPRPRVARGAHGAVVHEPADADDQEATSSARGEARAGARAATDGTNTRTRNAAQAT